MHCIDLNCDLGEGAGHDTELMPCITSANIACGGHAGDAATMRAAVALARQHGVAVGAHPGFSDREHFGRRELPLEGSAVAALVCTQIQALQEVAFDLGTAVRHVKLHGALYNMASRDQTLAESIVRILRMTAKNPMLFVLAGSELERVARAYDDVHVVAEAFADRTYQADGALTPRSRPDALIQDEDTAVAQVLRLIREGRVRATDGTDVPVRADTICVHGDGPQAVAFARRLARELKQAGIELRAPAARRTGD